MYALGAERTDAGRRQGEVLLPTPVADHSRGLPQPGTDYASLPNAVLSLLPTPRATDGTKGGPNQRGSSGDLMLPSAVVQLLPTPGCAGGGKKIPDDAVWSGKAAYKPSGQKVQVHIDQITRLLPTPTAMDSKASGGSSPSDVTLTDATVRTQLGATSNPRFAAGSASRTDQLPGQLSLDATESA